MINTESHLTKRERTLISKSRKAGQVLAIAIFGLLSVFGLSACSQGPNQSIFKIETGDKTLVDIRKNASDNVQVEFGTPNSPQK